MNSNETQHTDFSIVVGKLDLPAASVGNTTIHYLGKAKDVFVNDEYPSLTARKTAFMVTTHDDHGLTLDTFKAIVTGVRRYAISESDSGIDLELFITYERADERYIPSGITRIPPTITKILARDDFLGLYVEGEMGAVDSYCEHELKTVSHGGTIYYQVRRSSAYLRLGASNPNDAGVERSNVGTLVVLSTKKLPDTEAVDRFNAIFYEYVTWGTARN